VANFTVQNVTDDTGTFNQTTIYDDVDIEAYIHSIDRYGKMIVYFSEETRYVINETFTIQGIENTTTLTWVHQVGLNTEVNRTEVPFNVTSHTGKLMVFQIDFSDVSEIISLNQRLDILVAHFNDTSWFPKKSNGFVSSVTKWVLDHDLFPQMPANTTLLARTLVASKYTIGALTGGFTVGFALQAIFAGSLQNLWGTINTLQLSVHIPLIQLTFPLLPQSLINILISIITFDLIRSDEITSLVLEFSPEMEAQFTSNFEALNYETRASVLNLGMVFYIGLLLLIGWAATLIVTLLLYCCENEPTRKVQRRLLGWLSPSVHIRFFLESYLEIAIACIIGLQNVSFAETGDTFSTFMSFQLLFTVIGFPIVAFTSVSYIRKR